MPFSSGPKEMYAAVESGNLRALQDLIASGVDLNSAIDAPSCETDMTALMVAAEAGHAVLVQPLLEAGAHVNFTNSNGSTALMYAAENGHTDVAQALLAAGAKLQAVNDLGMTALTIACRKGFTSTVQAMVAAGADIHAGEVSKNRSGYTPLMIAAAGGHTATVLALIAAGADIQAAAFRYWAGVTALHSAAASGSTTTAQALLAAGADHRQITAKGRTPLISAARRGHTAIVAVLLAAGADVNQANSIGKTALLAAVLHGYAETVRVLLAAGADTDAMRNGYSAFGVASLNGHCSVVKAMLPHCSTARLQEGLVWAIKSRSDRLHVTALVLLELSARGKAAAAVASVLQMRLARVTTAKLNLAMLHAWAQETTSADARLAAGAGQQQELAEAAQDLEPALTGLLAQES